MIDHAHVNRVRDQLATGTYPMRRALEVVVDRLAEELELGVVCPIHGCVTEDGFCVECGEEDQT